MRTTILSVMLIISVAVKAQTALSGGFMNYIHPAIFTNDRLSANYLSSKKWSLTTYSGISTNFLFYNTGNATAVAVPIGLQLTRRLNENLYAYAGISVAPAYINFSGPFGKGPSNNGMFKYGAFDAYTRAEMGMMYVNDAKTFSISGSIGVQRSSYPYLPYRQINGSKQNTVNPSKN